MSVSLCISSEVDFRVVCCYKKLEYEKDLYRLLPPYDGHHFLKLGPLFIVLHPPFSHLQIAKRFDNSGHRCGFELYLHRNASGIFAGWHNVHLFAIPPSYCLSHKIDPPG